MGRRICLHTDERDSRVFGDSQSDVMYEVLDRHGNIVHRLKFQDGPAETHRVNGLTNEQLISVLIDRIGKLNSAFPCPENDRTVSHLHNALDSLDARTMRRMKRGVEGKNEE